MIESSLTIFGLAFMAGFTQIPEIWYPLMVLVLVVKRVRRALM